VTQARIEDEAAGKLITGYGARGVGSTFDDTVGIQAAVNDAYGRSHLVVPPPPVGGFYNIKRTIKIPSGVPSLMEMYIEGRGGVRSQCVYTGPDGLPVFLMTGVRNSRIDGVRVDVVGGQRGVTVFDIGTSADAPSTGTIEFGRCDVDLGAGIDCTAYRINHRRGGIEDASQIHWNIGTVYGKGRAAGSTGIRVEGGNSLIFSATNFGGSSLDKFFTNEGGGGGCINLAGLSCSGNRTDIVYASSDTLQIASGRFEEGGTLLYVMPGTTHASVTLEEVMCEAYGSLFTPGYALLNIDRPVTLILRNCRFPASNTTSTGKVVYLGGYNDGPTQTHGTLIVEGGGFPSADFYSSLSAPGGTQWKVYIRGAMVLDSLGRPTAKIPDIIA
jgi:hypothetical protein